MSDAFSPDVGQVIAPDGTITYDFAGHIHAQGLDLDAAPAFPPSVQQEIRWINVANGAVVASIATRDSGGAPVESKWTAYSDAAPEPAATRLAQLRLAVQDAFPGNAQVIVECDYNAGPNPGSVARTLLDQQGRSDYLQQAVDVVRFLQLLTPAGHELEFGTDSFVGDGTNDITIAQPHGLPNSPVFAIGVPLGWVGWMSMQAPDAANLNMDAIPGDPAGTFGVGATFFYFWLAIS